MWLFAIFVLFPLIEISLFITIGSWLTLWPTLAIVLLSAVVGSALIRRQGAMTMMELRRAMEEMRDPSRPLADGAMILLAGVLLVTPGFLTDTIGILLLIPPVRCFAFAEIGRRIRVNGMVMMNCHPIGPHSGPRPGPQDPRFGAVDTIEGDFEEIDPHAQRPNGGTSGWTRH